VIDAGAPAAQKKYFGRLRVERRPSVSVIQLLPNNRVNSVPPPNPIVRMQRLCRGRQRQNRSESPERAQSTVNNDTTNKLNLVVYGIACCVAGGPRPPHVIPLISN
jgi:hypothetical protein